MHVDWAIPCRYAEVVPGKGATIIGAGADVAQVRSVPAMVQVLFAVRYVGHPDELDGEATHPFYCRTYAPDGTLIGEQGGHMTGGVEMLVSGYAAEVTVPAGVIFEADTTGTYRVTFGIDEHSIDVAIHVVEMSDVP